MGNETSSKTTNEQELENVVNNNCGNVNCSQKTTFNLVGTTNSTFGTINMSQYCVAKKVCALNAMIDSTASQEAAANTTKAFLSALPGESTSSMSKNKSIIKNKIENDCGSVSNVQETISNIASHDNLNVDEIIILQKGEASLDCQIDAISKMQSAQKGKSATESTGPLQFLENLSKGPGMILLIGAVVVLGGGGMVAKGVTGPKIGPVPIWMIVVVVALVAFVAVKVIKKKKKEKYNGSAGVGAGLDDLLV